MTNKEIVKVLFLSMIFAFFMGAFWFGGKESLMVVFTCFMFMCGILCISIRLNKLND